MSDESDEFEFSERERDALEEGRPELDLPITIPLPPAPWDGLRAELPYDDWDFEVVGTQRVHEAAPGEVIRLDPADAQTRRLLAVGHIRPAGTITQEEE